MNVHDCVGKLTVCLGALHGGRSVFYKDLTIRWKYPFTARWLPHAQIVCLLRCLAYAIAAFLPLTGSAQGYLLTVEKSGNGLGTVTSTPAGINCGSSCASSFGAGTSVTLRATPTAGSSFLGWFGGCGISSDPTCVAAMTTSRTVAAVFTTTTNAAPSTANATGLWWNANESGWGVNVNQQGDVLFATLFNYDATGAPMWLVMSSGARQSDGSFTGDLYETTGPPFNSSPFPPIGPANLTRVGSMRLFFSSASAGSLTYDVRGQRVTKSITKQQFGTRLNECTSAARADRATVSNYTDLWWVASESGWGMNIDHQDNIIFATLFTYQANGRGQWFVMSSGVRQPDYSYVGDLYRTTGPSFNAQPFQPIGAGNLTKVGRMRLRFLNGEIARLEYDVNGTSVSKLIARQVFGSTVPECTSETTDVSVSNLALYTDTGNPQLLSYTPENGKPTTFLGGKDAAGTVTSVDGMVFENGGGARDSVQLGADGRILSIALADGSRIAFVWQGDRATITYVSSNGTLRSTTQETFPSVAKNLEKQDSEKAVTNGHALRVSVTEMGAPATGATVSARFSSSTNSSGYSLPLTEVSPGVYETYFAATQSTIPPGSVARNCSAIASAVTRSCKFAMIGSGVMLEGGCLRLSIASGPAAPEVLAACATVSASIFIGCGAIEKLKIPEGTTTGACNNLQSLVSYFDPSGTNIEVTASKGAARGTATRTVVATSPSGSVPMSVDLRCPTAGQTPNNGVCTPAVALILPALMTGTYVFTGTVVTGQGTCTYRTDGNVTLRLTQSGKTLQGRLTLHNTPVWIYKPGECEVRREGDLTTDLLSGSIEGQVVTLGGLSGTYVNGVLRLSGGELELTLR